MSTNLLLVSPYNVNSYGGVQNQVKLFKDGLDNTNFNVRILAPDSSDYNIGNSFKIPFNGSNNPVSLLPNKKILNEDSTDSKSEDQPSVVENNQPESVDSSVDQLSSSQNDNKEQNDDNVSDFFIMLVFLYGNIIHKRHS